MSTEDERDHADVGRPAGWATDAGVILARALGTLGAEDGTVQDATSDTEVDSEVDTEGDTEGGGAGSAT